MMVRPIGAILILLLTATRATAAACTTAYNCSYNGACSPTGTCACDAGWKGAYCEQLDVLPIARNGSGVDTLHTSNKTSSWGGAALRDPATGMYHMWYSEMQRHCGIHRWLTNSVVRHATAPRATGPWTPREVVFPIFAHEPSVARAPNGAWVLYVTHFDGPAVDKPDGTCNCTTGDSKSGGCFGEPSCGKNESLYSYMSISEAGPSGPWSPLVSLAAVQQQAGIGPTVDMNLAPVILADGSVVAWNRWDIWKAGDWRNASSWTSKCAGCGYALAPTLNFGAGEDPFVWRDKGGHWHVLTHNGDRGMWNGTHGDCGRHFFSTTGDAGTWDAAPLDRGGCAYIRNATIGGTRYTFYRRERPHLIFGDGGPEAGAPPLALTTAVVDSPGYGRDASYTLLQPIRQRP